MRRPFFLVPCAHVFTYIYVQYLFTHDSNKRSKNFIPVEYLIVILQNCLFLYWVHTLTYLHIKWVHCYAQNLNSNIVILPNEKNRFILYWIYISLLTHLTSPILHTNKLWEAKTSFHNSAILLVPPVLTRVHMHLIIMFLRSKT